MCVQPGLEGGSKIVLDHFGFNSWAKKEEIFQNQTVLTVTVKRRDNVNDGLLPLIKDETRQSWLA